MNNDILNDITTKESQLGKKIYQSGKFIGVIRESVGKFITHPTKKSAFHNMKYYKTYKNAVKRLKYENTE